VSLVEVGSVVTSVLLVLDRVHGRPGFGFNLQITLWLWFTVLFATLCRRPWRRRRRKAQADALRRAKAETHWRTVCFPAVRRRPCQGQNCARETWYWWRAGEFIPGDGEIVGRAWASVDESAITGESAPVIREAGGDRSAGDRWNPRTPPTGSR